MVARDAVKTASEGDQKDGPGQVGADEGELDGLRRGDLNAVNLTNLIP